MRVLLASWLDFHRKRHKTARTANIVLAFFARQAELSVAMRAFFVDVLTVRQRALAVLEKASKRTEKLTKSAIFFSALGYVAGHKTKDGVAKKQEVCSR